MQAFWTPEDPDSAAVTLADNAAGRGPSERIFEDWRPGPITQEVQNAARVDADSRFVHPRGNVSASGTLTICWADPNPGNLGLLMTELAHQIRGLGTLEIVLLGGQTLTLDGACFESINFTQVLPVRFTAEIRFVGEQFLSA